MSDLGITIWRKLEKPGPELAGYLMAYEGIDPDVRGWWVEADRPRDFVWTEEIVEKTVAFGLVSSTGKMIAEFESLEDAIEAERTAEIDFTTKVKVGRKVVPVETVTAN